MTWQPIETAPKDGTNILVFYDHEADPLPNGERKQLRTEYLNLTDELWRLAR